MKRLAFLVLTCALALQVFGAGSYTHKDRAWNTQPATVDGDGIDTARVDDTVLIARSEVMSSYQYRIITLGPIHTKRNLGDTDTAWIRIKSKSGDWWTTLDSFRVELPDTTVGTLSRLIGDTLIGDAIYLIRTIRDTASDSIMSVGWTGSYNFIVKE